MVEIALPTLRLQPMCYWDTLSWFEKIPALLENFDFLDTFLEMGFLKKFFTYESCFIKHKSNQCLL